MRDLRSGALPATLLGLVLALAGCGASETGPATQPSPSGTAGTPSNSPEALVGNYSVEYRTTESDQQVITDETIVRAGEITGTCNASDCDLAFTIELKAPDGSTSTGTTALTFDGAAYQGSQLSTFNCDGLTSLTTIEDGLEYTSETTITPTGTVVEDGVVVVASFDVVTVERNEITAAGREAGCLKINPSGPDPFVSQATTVGVGTRQ